MLGKSTWAVLALTCHIELFSQAHYRESIARTPSCRRCSRTSSCSTGRKSRSTPSSTSSSGSAKTRSSRRAARDAAVDDLIALVGGVDGILQAQAAADADYFLRVCAAWTRPRRARAAGRATVLKAYRWQYIVSGARHPRFCRALGRHDHGRAGPAGRRGAGAAHGLIHASRNKEMDHHGHRLPHRFQRRSTSRTDPIDVRSAGERPGGRVHFHRGAEYAVERLGYDPVQLGSLPAICTSRFAGVGNPLRIGPLRAGETVLDHACGAGVDLLLAARKVGKTGRAIGVDMTPSMRALALSGAAQAGLLDVVQVHAGLFEDLPVEDATVDVVISERRRESITRQAARVS